MFYTLTMKLLKYLVTILLLISFISNFGVPFVQEYLKQTVVFVERDGPQYDYSFLPTITLWSSVSRKDYDIAYDCFKSKDTVGEVVTCLKNHTGLKSENLKFRSCGTHELLNITAIPSYGMVLHGAKFSINSSFVFECILIESSQNVSLNFGTICKDS